MGDWIKMEYEELQLITRKPKTKEQKALVKRCFIEGKKNGWASGDFARQDGDYISEEDCLNENSIIFIVDEFGLIDFFRDGNWCLGQGIIYENLFFLQQVDGGDEWAVYLIKEDEIKSFESWSIKAVLDGEGGKKEFIEDLNKMMKGDWGK